MQVVSASQKQAWAEEVSVTLAVGLAKVNSELRPRPEPGPVPVLR